MSRVVDPRDRSAGCARGSSGAASPESVTCASVASAAARIAPSKLRGVGDVPPWSAPRSAARRVAGFVLEVVELLLLRFDSSCGTTKKQIDRERHRGDREEDSASLLRSERSAAGSCVPEAVAHAAHGEDQLGLFGSGSSFSRRWRMWTSIVRGSR